MKDPLMMRQVTYPGFSPDPILIGQQNQKRAMSRGDIDRVSEEFESLFLSQMLAPMFETVGNDGYMSGGQSEEMYRSFLTDEYGKLMARAGGIGIADHVKRELLKLQEVNYGYGNAIQ